jgi:hypothetical protein
MGDSEAMTVGVVPGNGCRTMNDGDWLNEVYKEAERESRELPDWARPVQTPPADISDSDISDTDE